MCERPSKVITKVLSFGGCSYKILSPLPLILQTKGCTPSREPSDFAIAAILQAAFVLAICA
jgi:hypothetical protein